MQAVLMGRADLITSNIKDKVKSIFNQLRGFKDSDGYYYWAKDNDGLSDNSLVTATMSIYLSLKALDN